MTRLRVLTERERTTGPTASSCWLQAYRETLPLPSWERERKLRPRYEELLKLHGLVE